jgi:2,5-diketo-D-gluconate reductase A
MNSGREIAQLGFGVFQVPPVQTVAAVLCALQTGYRMIDTAEMYGNEAAVGEAITRSGLDRSEVFVTTKVWNDHQGRGPTRRAFERSLEQLGSDYVDLYLIHWPAPARDLYVETWETLIELHTEGRAHSIGVSNFLTPHLERIIEATGVVPSVNQVELHPRFQRAELRRYHARSGILTEAWSPLGRGRILTDHTIGAIASGHGRTPAQIVLRWHLQLENIAIPRSVNPARIEENFQIFDFELSDDEMRLIAELDTGERIGPDPARFG